MELFADIFWDEWIAFIFGLFYLFLAASEKPVAWIFGIISCAFWAYGTFIHYQLYFDMILNVFYVIVGFFGLYVWLYGGEDKGKKNIEEISIQVHIYFIIGGLILMGILGYIFHTYTEATLPYLDALTTIFSIFATFLLVYKIPANWIYWIVMDAIYVGIYFYSGADIYGVLFIINTVMAVYGYWNWRRKIGEKQIS